MLGCCCYRSFHMYGSIWFMGERKRKKNDFIVGIFAIVLFCGFLRPTLVHLLKQVKHAKDLKLLTYLRQLCKKMLSNTKTKKV